MKMIKGLECLSKGERPTELGFSVKKRRRGFCINMWWNGVKKIEPGSLSGIQ